jgi:predicted kinase
MITIVTGPPCGGKSTHIEENCKPGDIIIDMDRIALALSPEGTDAFGYSQSVRTVARAARKSAVQAALGVAQGQRSVWGLDYSH